MSLLQNKFTLSAISLAVVAMSLLFIVQPTVVRAKALAQAQINGDGSIAIFGHINLADGTPLSGVQLAVGQSASQDDGQDTFNIFDRTASGDDGAYKLWIEKDQVQQLTSDTLLISLRTDDGSAYYQSIKLQPHDIASVTITMRTSLIPIFPFTTFVY